MPRHWYAIGSSRIWWPDGQTPAVAVEVHRFPTKASRDKYVDAGMFRTSVLSSHPLIRKAARLLNSDSPEGNYLRTYGFPVEISTKIDYEQIETNAYAEMLPGMQSLDYVVDVRADETPGSLRPV